MKRLQEYIYEERIDNKNVVLWQTIEVPEEGYSEQWAEKAIEEMLPELEKKIIAAIILATDTKNKEDIDKYELSVRKAAENAGPNYKAFLKLDDAGKSKWIEDKIQAIKTSSEKDKEWARKYSSYPRPRRGTDRCPIIWSPTLKKTDNINIEGRYVYVHNDIIHQQSCQQLKFTHDYKNFANDIISTFPAYPKDCLKHLKYIYVYTTDKDLFSLEIIHITFGFDDELEDKLSKSVKSFNDYMTREYDSGRYMGD